MRRLVGFMVAAVVIVGCGDDETIYPIDIRGVVTAVTVAANPDADVLGTILIVGAVEEDTTHDRASVKITRTTSIRSESGDEMDFAALTEGDSVEATFTGPVAESYPVQATAKTVTILDAEPTSEGAP